MKIISWVVLFCLTFNTFAATGSLQELEQALDGYQYALTVDWDQKDKAVYEKATNQFFQKLSALVQQGVTREQILSLAEKKMGDSKAVEALKLKLTLLSNVKTSEELAKALSDNAGQFYSRGASWDGSTTIMVGVGVFFAALIGYSIWFNATHECAQYDEQWVCHTYNNNNCSSFDTYCDSYSSSTETCGWENVCTLWVRKQK